MTEDVTGVRDHVTNPDEWFAANVAEHWAVMHRVAARLAGVEDTADVLQDAVTIAWRRHSSFDPERGTYRSWLLFITADQARKHWNGRRDRPASGEIFDAVEDLGRTASEELIDLRRAVDVLPRRQREVVNLHYYAQLTVAEIAVAIGCAEGTVKSTLSDARRALRSRLGVEYR